MFFLRDCVLKRVEFCLFVILVFCIFSDEERQRDSPADKRESKKGIKEAYNVPLTLVSRSERRDYGEDRVINLDA